MKHIKCISVLVAIIMVFGCFTAFSVSDTEEFVETKDIKLLSELGFWNSDLNHDNLSRAEFAQLLDKIINLNSNDPLRTLCDLGIMKSYKNGNIASDEPVNFEQVVAAMVCIAGYETMAHNLGGYPTGYIAQAKKLGILKESDLTSGTNVSTEGIAKIIVNTLDVDLFMQNIYGDVGIYKINENSNLLNVYHKIYRDRGKVTDNGISRLYIPTSAISQGFAVINDTVYSAGDVKITKYLGCMVDYYYKENRGEIPSLISVNINENNNRSIVMAAEDIIDAEYTSIEYYTSNGSRRTASISGAAYIYNGVAFPDCKESDMQPNIGNIELISSNGSSNYDVVKIWSYTDYVVEDLNIDTYELKARYGKTAEIDPNDCVIEVFDTDGNAKFVVDINQDSVISVAVSMNGNYKKVLLSKKTVEGRVNKIGNSNGKSIVSIDGNSYEISSEYIADTHFSKYEIGIDFNGIFYLNAFGQIAGADKAKSTDMLAGFIIGSAKGSVFEPVQVKLFSETGEMKIFDCAKKIKIDGQRPVSDDDTVSKLSQGKFVLYKLNKDGELAQVDTTDLGSVTPQEAGKTLHLDAEGSMYYRSSNGFDGKVFVSNSTVVLKVEPKNDISGDESYYRVSRGNNFGDSASYGIAAYSIDENSFISDYVVHYSAQGSGTVSNSTRLILVEEVYDKLENEEIVKAVKGLRLGTAVEYTMRKNDIASTDGAMINEISGGDIIRAQIIEGKIEAWERVYDYDTGQFFKQTDYTYGAEMHIAYGSVTRVRENIMEIARNAEPDDQSAERLKYKASGYKIMIYDTSGRKPKVYSGKYTDIKSYEDYPGEFAKAVVFQEWGDPRDLIIYKK